MEPCFGLLFWFCLALGLFGLGTMTVGIIVQVIYFSGAGFIETNFLETPSLLIVIGGIIFIVAFLGCCGAVKRHYCLLMTFGIFMLVLFILGVAGGIACYLARGGIESVLNNNLNKTLQLYPNNTEIRKSWDVMQHELKCCGVNSVHDWAEIGNGTIPNSCCSETPFNDAKQLFECPESSAYQTGCLQSFLDSFKNKTFILGMVAVAVAFVQIVIVIFTCYLAGTIRGEYQTV